MGVAATFANTDDRDRAISTLRTRLPDLEFTEREENGKQLLMGALNPAAVQRVQDSALKQHINTLHNRINELGVAEPVIQQQGPRNCWAGPPRLKSAWSTTPPPRKPRCWAAPCPSAWNATTTATAVRSWSAARSS
ncbi:hypothetical protein G6F57_022023 [Rhizopus arrhizus]|nr:hypothetical protein G6F57_022023 [Rhizopus arrhizus]